MTRPQTFTAFGGRPATRKRLPSARPARASSYPSSIAVPMRPRSTAFWWSTWGRSRRLSRDRAEGRLGSAWSDLAMSEVGQLTYNQRNYLHSQPVSAPQTDFSSPSALRAVERRQARCLGPLCHAQAVGRGRKYLSPGHCSIRRLDCSHRGRLIWFRVPPRTSMRRSTVGACNGRRQQCARTLNSRLKTA